MSDRLTSSPAARAERLARLRERLRAAGIDALIVRGTDRYLNEYVPAGESLRIWLSGFTGSVGDLLVTAEAALVFVDGRYHLQAEQEVDPARFGVVKVPLGTSLEEAMEQRLAELASKQGPGWVLGFEPETFSLELLERFSRALARQGARLVPVTPNPVAALRGELPAAAPRPLEIIPETASGESVAARLERLRTELARLGLDGLLLTRLDEIAWLCSARSYEIDFSSTFRSLAWVGRTRAALFVDPRKLDEAARAALAPSFDFAPEEGWSEGLSALLGGAGRLRALLDPAGSTVAHELGLRSALGEGGEVLRQTSPVPAMKARKNAAELKSMSDSFRRADRVVEQAIAWLNKRLARGRPVSEAGLAAEVERLFLAAGARGLSFRVISAAGANGAVIHYSHPDPARRIKQGELVLLDTGAYFEAGYATDLTRTFLAGGSAARPDRKQKLIFTLVLKAAIRGMKARFPVGTTGVQLDAITRAPLWEAGHDYNHGTGHGVGVLVHEFPPRISSRSMAPIEAGQVFSIEPGIYLAGWGGVRIENLVTVEEDRKAPGFLRVRPLTFSPLDRRLIDGKLLSPDEKAWLRQYFRGRV